MPQKIDSAGQPYFEGDNIRITVRDLAWIRETTFPPPTVLPKEAEIRPRTLPAARYHVIQFGKRA